ncbi:MAG: transglutaminaseTgpA domain-containing protein, partial [Micrococcaceae bacterium]|nr:transglutaminaseTgpA domain-containing protein [Micrococcaceae bacterium]
MSAPTLAKPRDPEPARPARTANMLPLKPAGFAMLATLVAVLGSVASLHGVISGWDWMFQASVVVAGIALSANLVRVFSARRYLATLVGAIAAVLLLTTIFFPATAWLGVFPTTSTYHALLRVWALANDQMGSQVPPVQTTGVIIFSVCIWAAAVTLAVDTLAFELRAAALAGLPLAMMLSIAALFKAHGAGPATLSITAVGYLLILAASRLQSNGFRGPKRRALELDSAGQDPGASLPVNRRAGGALLQGTVLVAGALAALLLLPLAVPGFTKGMLPEGKRPAWGQLATNIDPLIALGNDLRSRSQGTVLRYFTDSKSPTYLRTSVIGGLDSARWEPDPEIFRFPVTENLATLSFPTVVESAPQVFTRVVTDKYRGVWMPLPENSIWLNGLDDSWRWSPDTGTLRAAEDAKPAAEDYAV